MKKKLFIYYSHTGNGDLVADFLKHTYDIRKVYVKKDIPSSFILSIMTGGFKALINYHDELVDFDDKIEEYDEIVIGSPVWNDRLSSPINSVLDILKLNDKKVKFILYSGSGKASHALIQLEKYNIKKVYILKEPIQNVQELNKIKDL